MIIVSGSMRSGTSMWMQILSKAGFPFVGEVQPAHWAGIAAANPDGFYESSLRFGINSKTNPDPQTQAYLRPEDTHGHLVKVFTPGLAKTDLAYVSAVVATIRPWHEYARSIRELRKLDRGENSKRVELHPQVQWFVEQHTLLRDALTRKYGMRLIPYEHVLAAPRKTIRSVIEWLGNPRANLGRATAVVKPKQTSGRNPPEYPEPADATLTSHCEALYERIATSKPLDPEFILRLNAEMARLAPILEAHHEALQRQQLNDKAAALGLRLVPAQ